jgi:hypothetical protein|tara:strand:- start:357 stop:608 length:252 start_codon:yes stop_codon:yes gene_type:complete
MIDKYKDQDTDNLSVSYNVDTKTTTIANGDLTLDSLSYSSLKSCKQIAQDLGLTKVIQYKLTKNTFNIDGSKRGYVAFREENK